MTKVLSKIYRKSTVFVFGSNMAGNHAGGAARTALQYFGAMQGVGRGWSGQKLCHSHHERAFATDALVCKFSMILMTVKIYTKNHPKMTYFITSVGCGIAGYKTEEIAPMFKGISHNVHFPRFLSALL